MEDWLQIVEERLDYRRWFCGRFHIEKQVADLRFVYYDILEFKPCLIDLLIRLHLNCKIDLPLKW